jgi:hypothetical protein
MEALVDRPEHLHVVENPPLQSIPVGEEASRTLAWTCLPLRPAAPVPVDWSIVFEYRDLSDRTFRTFLEFKVDAEYGISPRLIQRVRKVRAKRAPVAP